MQKSFYYVVTWGDSAHMITALNELDIPYEIECHERNQNRFVFPDAPVRVYGQVRKLFGGDGHAYQK